MRPPNIPPPVSDAEVARALHELKRYPSGITRKDAAAMFSSDRRARDVMAALAELGLAAVVCLPSPVHGGEKTYRIARDLDEVNRAVSEWNARQRSLERRKQGCMNAFQNGTRQPQAGMFEAP